MIDEIEQNGVVFAFKGVWSGVVRYVAPVAIAIILVYIIVTGNYF